MNSELRKIMTLDVFKTAYTSFMAQVETNAITKKANGRRMPFGIGKEYKKVDDCNLSQHFGQGTPSKTPYLNWHVVSIYYHLEEGKIYLGIEEDRFPSVERLEPIRYEKFKFKTSRIAVFYESTKENIEWVELHNNFIKVSEKVMKQMWD